MGKYFKEDNNKRVSQVKADVDVESLAKRLIMAQGGLVKTITTTKPSSGSFYARLPGKNKQYLRTQPGGGLKYVKDVEPNLLGKILGRAADFLLPGKLKVIKIFLEELNKNGKFDKFLSKTFDQNKINATLDKEYPLLIAGKSKVEDVTVRKMLYNFNPETGVMDGKVYKFTPAQIDELYIDFRTISDQADKWAKIKAGGTAVGAGGLATWMNIDQAKDRSREEVKNISPTIQTITKDQTQTYDDTVNPVDARKNR